MFKNFGLVYSYLSKIKLYWMNTMHNDGKNRAPEQFSNHRANLFKTVSSDEFGDQYDIKKILLGLRKHIPLIVTTTLVLGLLGIYTTYNLLKTYKAEAVLVYNEDQALSKDIPGGYSLSNPSLATSVDMIMSPKNFEAVKSILGLDLPLIDLMNMVYIPSSKLDSKLRRVEVRNDNPHLAVDIVNTLSKVVVKNSQEYKRQQLKTAIDNFRSQLVIAKQELNTQNEEIEDFKNEHQYFEAEPNYTSVLAEIENARTALNAVDLNYQGLLIEYENLKKEAQLLPDTVPLSRESKENPYNLRITTLETALVQAKSKYTPENPKIKAMEEELNELVRKMKGPVDEVDQFAVKNPMKDTIGLELVHLQGKVRSAEKTKQELSRRVSELEVRSQRIPEQQKNLSRLIQDKLLTQEQVKFLSNAVDSTQLLMNAPKGSIEIYELAKTATLSNDKWWVNFIPAFTLLLGLGTGLALASILEVMDRFMRTPKQVSIAYTIPCLVTIPEIPSLNVDNGEKKSVFYFRELAEKIERIIGKGKPYTVLVTSSKDNEGKSFVSHYLGQYYKTINKKILVLEFDEAFNPFATPPTHSLSELIQNPSLITDSTEHIRINDKHVSLKNTLNSSEFENFWKALKTHFDVIIVDAPGIIHDGLAINLSSISDVVLFVLASSMTEKKVVDESLHVFESFGISPSGIILNRADPLYIDNERIKREMKRHD
jgi:uncharacterized protein involved in exopolysaccharide biosynthesis